MHTYNAGRYYPRKLQIMNTLAQTPTAADRTLLIVEDDRLFLQRLARAMETRGFSVRTAETVSEGLQQVEASAPAFAVVDMRLGDGLDDRVAVFERRPTGVKAGDRRPLGPERVHGREITRRTTRG